MTDALSATTCPYKGLQPYTEQDRTFFFGRERDQQIIISNLYAASLTILYGASGVGKSSVLLAGAVPLLRQEPSLSIVVFRNWQDPQFLGQLKQQAAAAAPNKTAVDPSLPFDELLAQLYRTRRTSSFFIFDQFEEYFLYNASPAIATGFEAEFARAVNRRDVTANFLLSMREDGLSKLDRFQGRIPTLMNNMLRLEHLDRRAAQDAITKPLEVYNQSPANSPRPMTVEPALVSAILDDLQGSRDVDLVGATGNLPSPDRAPGTIETPFLQMVLTRLWDEERAAQSATLRMQTYASLGRAANIARTHLDNILGGLTDAERDIAANLLRFLVTPSGTKIAQEAGALALWTELPETTIQPILDRLSSPELRILRTVQTPGRPLLYELFHDVLAQAVLNWRRRYVAAQQEQKIRRDEQVRLAEQREDAERRRERERSRFMRRALIVLSSLFVLTIAAMGFALWQTRQASKAKQHEFDAQKQADSLKDQAEKAKDEQAQAELHERDGYVFLQKGKFADAAYEYGEALKLDRKNATLYNSRGYALMRAGNLSDSISVLQQAIEIDPKNIWGHYNLGLSYHKNKNDDDAVKECLKVLELDNSFCDTFKKDANYAWFTCSKEFQANCGAAKCSVAREARDTSTPRP